MKHDVSDRYFEGQPGWQPDDPDTRTNGSEPVIHAASSVREPDRTRPGQAPALAHNADILDEFLTDLRALGVAGEERLAQLVYLAVTSRLLPWGKSGERPVSLCAKGTSATGKSYTTSTVLKFFPERAWIDYGSISRRYLFYTDEDFAHRFLVIPEWASIKDDEELVTLLRVLLSEGRVVHGTVEGDGKKTARKIEKEGPTGLLLTTTAAAVDAELETRLLAVTTDDTPAQTRRVFQAIASLEDDADDVDLYRWHELQRWLAESGEYRVSMPYLHALADLMPADATRLRRDFASLTSLIRAHALLYQAQRERDPRGRIVATTEDYAVVRALVGDLIAEGVEASVTDAMRETVEAVQATIDGGKSHAGPKDIIDRLAIGRSASYDRIQGAERAGYIVNEAGRNERSKRLVVGAPLPGSGNFLPSVDALVRYSSGQPTGHGNLHDDTDSDGLSGSPASPVDPPDEGPDTSAVTPNEEPEGQVSLDMFGDDETPDPRTATLGELRAYYDRNGLKPVERRALKHLVDKTAREKLTRDRPVAEIADHDKTTNPTATKGAERT